MPKFSILHLLVGVSLIAIVVSLTQTEGCGKRVQYIDTISFSRDGSRVLVSAIAGRYEFGSPTYELKHISRTISWLDRTSGRTLEVVHQDYKPQILYSMFGDLENSVVRNPANDQIAAIELGGPRVSLDIQSLEWLDCIPYPADQMVFSKHGRYLAVYAGPGLSVIDVVKKSQVLRIPTHVLPVNWCKFSNDEKTLIVSDANTIDTWDVESSLLVSSTSNDRDSYLNVLASGPDDAIFVHQGADLEQCDIFGNKLVEIAKGYFHRCSVSADGKTLAACRNGSVDIFILEDKSLQTSIPLGSLEAIEISSDGKVVLLGRNGKLQLFDTATGELVWWKHLQADSGQHRMFH